MTLTLTEGQTLLSKVERRQKRILSREYSLNKSLRQEDVGGVNGQLVVGPICCL